MKEYFCEEDVFGYVWENADADGLWAGDDAAIAAEFGVSEDESYAMLSELCGRGLLEKLPGKYAVTKWPERNDPGEEELLC